ncbi:14-alpha sterol demethylase Cyp51B protein [Rutstroemia sp. NJR-2017a BBW]|nr:14-alpha sterol demethylase Cyp51B protein [Rutstroemia sp. NJR-2017a BBW]
MGILRTTLSTALLGATGAAGGWAFWTRNSKFVPISASDPIFSSRAYKRNNPNNNPATQDLCVRKVPLGKIKPHLLEKEGKLVEAFCAGVWGGSGYAYQRHYLSKKYQNTTTTAHQLWERPALLSSTYDVGTQITDHFEVVSKTPEAITVRCGDSPLKTGVRESDGLFEMGAKIDRNEGVAVFSLKSVFYKGTGKETGKPMPEHVEFAHRLYTKLWMETAVQNVVM